MDENDTKKKIIPILLAKMPILKLIIDGAPYIRWRESNKTFNDA